MRIEVKFSKHYTPHPDNYEMLEDTAIRAKDCFPIYTSSENLVMMIKLLFAKGFYGDYQLFIINDDYDFELEVNKYGTVMIDIYRHYGNFLYTAGIICEKLIKQAVKMRKEERGNGKNRNKN